MFPEHIYTDMRAIEMTGVLLGSMAQWEPDAHFQAWQVGTAEGRVDVVIPSSDLSHTLLSQAARPQRFQLIQWDTADGALAMPLVTEATPLADGYCTDYLPPDVCPVAGVVADARELIGSIATDPLRRFVHAVLEERFTCNRFWTMPASARHHQAHPGGLAQHSVEVAQDMATQGQLTGIERDLGWVFHSRKGLPIDVVNFANRVWYPLLRHLGLKLRPPYQMRHTAATLMLAAGENPEWVASILGHSTTEMLFRVYSRFIPNLTRNDGLAFAGLLNNRIAKPAATSPVTPDLSKCSREQLEAMVRGQIATSKEDGHVS